MADHKETEMDTEEHESYFFFSKFVQDLSGESLLLIQQEHVVVIACSDSLDGNNKVDSIIDRKPNQIYHNWPFPKISKLDVVFNGFEIDEFSLIFR